MSSRSRLAGFVAVSLAAIAVLWPSPAFAKLDDALLEDYADIWVRQMRAGSGPQGASLIMRLAALDDPKLQPLFAEVLASGDPVQRVESILALAKISEESTVSSVQIASLKQPRNIALVLSRAINDELIDQDQLVSMMRWPDLDPQIVTAIAAQLHSRGIPIDTKRLGSFAAPAQNNPLEVRLPAMLVLESMGERDPGSSLELIRALEPRSREAAVLLALGFIERSQLTGLAAFLQGLATQEWVDKPQRFAAIGELIRTAPTQGLGQWMAAWSSTDELADQLRLGIEALATAEVSRDPSACRLMAAETTVLIAAMGNACAATASGNDDAESLITLAETGYAPAIAWCLERADALPDAQAARLLAAIASRDQNRRSRSIGLSREGVVAIMRLGELDPGTLMPIIRDAIERRDESLLSVALTSVRAGSGRALWSADDRPRWPSQRSEALALLCEARWGKLPPAGSEDERRLFQIPLGWGGLPENIRGEAAWIIASAEDRAEDLIILAIEELN